MTNLIGQSLGRYHILEQLGEGGMATVYKAYDTRLDSEVAIKFIRMEKLTLENADKTRHRFKREARALANLTHPNIVKIIDFGEYEDQPYLVMPLLTGGTLKSKLTGQPIPYPSAAKILLPMARALNYAHKQKMIHRDVKPSNILLTESGEPLLSDFGVAKILEEDTTVDLTGSGVGIGTPEYMAPEQTGKDIDHRADIYSLGTVLYELITGRKPYQADTPLAILIKRASEPLPRPKTYVSDLPNHVEHVLLKALAKSPTDRYKDAGEFADILEKLAMETVGRPKFTGKIPALALIILAALILMSGLFTAYQYGKFATGDSSSVVDQPSHTAQTLEPISVDSLPVTFASTNTLAVILVETPTYQILEPQFDPDNPEGFLRWYFHSVWADRNYEVLWDYISVELQERLGVDYDGYVDNWEKIGSIIEPVTISFVRKDEEILVYRVQYTTLSRKSGFEDQRNDGYYLYFNQSKGHWEFK